MKKLLIAIATLALALGTTSGRSAVASPDHLIQAHRQAQALEDSARTKVGVEKAKLLAQAAELVASVGDDSGAARLAQSAASALTRDAVNRDAAGAAALVAQLTALVARPEVAKADPVAAAIVVTQATYVVNLPAVASIVATNPTVAANVTAVNNNTTTVANNADVKAAPANATIAADLKSATDIGKANVNISVTITPATSFRTNPNLPPIDVSVVSKSS